jgi:hypothetical protein
MRWVNILLLLATSSDAMLRVERHQAYGYRDWLRLDGLLLIGPDRKAIDDMSSIEYCQEECEKTNKCTSFALRSYANGRTCFLKKRAKNYILDKRAVSYVKPPLGFQCFSSSEFGGNDLYSIATSYEDCAARCDQDPRRCNGFTWALNEGATHGQCQLKELRSDAKLFDSHRGAISCQAFD